MNKRAWMAVAATVVAVGLWGAGSARAGAQVTVQQGGAPAGIPAAAGDTVLMNGLVAAVVRKDGSGVELCASSGGGWKQRARLCPAEGGKPLKISGASVTAGGGAEGAVKAALDGGRALVFSMNAADPVVKITPEGKVECLRFEAPCRVGILPDFFADDVLVDAQRIPVAKAEIPSDNIFLHMLGDGSCVLAAIWEKNDRDVELTLAGDGAARTIAATDVFIGSGGSAWIGVLECEGVWYSKELTKEEGSKGTELDWAVPYMAKWKGDFTREDGSIQSMGFGTPNSGWQAANVIDGKSGKLRAKVTPDSGGVERLNLGGVISGLMVVYPISRLADETRFPIWRSNPEAEGGAGTPDGKEGAGASRKGAPGETPLDRYCVDDLMRLSLGLGPCESILDLDARKPTYKGLFTCAHKNTTGYAVPYVLGSERRTAELTKEERVFLRRVDRNAITFVKNVQDRINLYLDFGTRLTAYLDEQEKAHPDQAAFIKRLRDVWGTDVPGYGGKKTKHADRANGEKEATDILEKRWAALKVDTVENAMDGLHTGVAGIGDPQDNRVRMLRRRVGQVRSTASMEMAMNPAVAPIAKEVRKMTEEALRNPHSYERFVVW